MDSTQNRMPSIRPTDAAHSFGRMLGLSVIALIALTGFTAGGITMVRRGDWNGLPFAIGGSAAQLSIITLCGLIARVRRRSGDEHSNRTALTAAVRGLGFLLLAILIVLAALNAYGLARFGDEPWGLVTTGIIDLVLGGLAVGVARLRGVLRSARDQH